MAKRNIFLENIFSEKMFSIKNYQIYFRNKLLVPIWEYFQKQLPSYFLKQKSI